MAPVGEVTNLRVFLHSMDRSFAMAGAICVLFALSSVVVSVTICACCGRKSKRKSEYDNEISPPSSLRDKDTDRSKAASPAGLSDASSSKPIDPKKSPSEKNVIVSVGVGKIAAEARESNQGVGKGTSESVVKNPKAPQILEYARADDPAYFSLCELDNSIPNVTPARNIPADSWVTADGKVPQKRPAVKEAVSAPKATVQSVLRVRTVEDVSTGRRPAMPSFEIEPERDKDNTKRSRLVQ